jgi:hypothetical protein
MKTFGILTRRIRAIALSPRSAAIALVLLTASLHFYHLGRRGLNGSELDTLTAARLKTEMQPQLLSKKSTSSPMG